MVEDIWIIDARQIRRARFSDRVIESVLTPLRSDGSPVGLLHGESAPVLSDGTLLVISGSTLNANDAETGTLLWERPLRFRGFPVLGAMCNVSADGTVLIAGYVFKDPQFVPQEIALPAIEGTEPAFQWYRDDALLKGETEFRLERPGSGGQGGGICRVEARNAFSSVSAVRRLRTQVSVQTG